MVKRVLITGGSGILGTALADLQVDKVFLDKSPAPPALKDQDFVQADITDKAALQNAMEGCDALIHLAGCSDAVSSDDDVCERILRDNIEGVTAAFTVARELGIERIILASSSHAVGMYECDNAPHVYAYGHGSKQRIDENAPARPDSLYGASKVFAEAFGRYLAETGGPKVYALRIGSVRSEYEDHPYAYAEWGVRKGLWKRGSREYAAQEGRLKSIWQSRRDFVQIIQKCLDYDGPNFDVFFSVSDNERGWLDITHAREALGYTPEDNSEGWLQIMTSNDACSNGNREALSAKQLQIAAIVPLRVTAENSIDHCEGLVRRTIESARESEFIDTIVLACDDESVLDHAEEWGVDHTILRPKELSQPGVRVDMVLEYVLDQLEAGGYSPDLIVPLEITFPFRPEGLLDNLILKLLSEKLDTAIAGFPEFRPAWYKPEEGVLRLDEYATTRDQRSPLHIGLSSLGCVTYAEFIRKGSRLGPHIGVLEVDDQLATIEIRTHKDLDMFRRLNQVT